MSNGEERAVEMGGYRPRELRDSPDTSFVSIMEARLKGCRGCGSALALET